MADKASGTATDVPFEISEVGETTGEKFPGSFRAKTRLSFRDQLRRDQIRRELLGGQPGLPTDRTMGTSAMLSEIAVRLTQSPKWWQEANDGLDLYDDNIVGAVYDHVMRIEREAAEAKKSAASKAAVAMREEQDEQDSKDSQP